ncbi:hypothetical protein CR513_56391, partial [Mucuna pruriens]
MDCSNKLLEFVVNKRDIEVVLNKVVKGNILVEYLAHQPIEDYWSVQCEFPNQDIITLFDEEENLDKRKWTLVFDEALNALGHGIGVVLICHEKHFIPFTTMLGFDCSNNVADYEACIMGIQTAIESKVKILEVFGDLVLVIHQPKEE